MGLCHDRVFYVVTVFGQDRRVSCCDRILLGLDRVGKAMSFLSRQNVSMLRRVWPNREVLCCDKEILCRNIVGQARKIFYRNRGFLGHDRVSQGKGKSSSRHSWPE